jgi:hypothetical protein
MAGVSVPKRGSGGQCTWLAPLTGLKAMTAYNAVRFKVKEGQEEAFMDAHSLLPPLAGLREAVIIKTGARSFCLIGRWDSMAALAAARPQMISLLDGFRHHLEDLGGGLGVTDPVSGDVVMDLRSP